MIISQRRYFFRYLITMLVLGTVLIMAVPIANNFIYKYEDNAHYNNAYFQNII